MTDKKRNYIIETADSLCNLQIKANLLMEHAYEPLGSPNCCPIRKKYFQAFILREIYVVQPELNIQPSIETILNKSAKHKCSKCGGIMNSVRCETKYCGKWFCHSCGHQEADDDMNKKTWENSPLIPPTPPTERTQK